MERERREGFIFVKLLTPFELFDVIIVLLSLFGN